MTTPILAGQKLRARDLNNIYPTIVRATVDTVRTNTTALANITGLGAALEANTVYLLDGFLAYDADTGGIGIRCAFTVPSGTTGSWMFIGLASGGPVGSDGSGTPTFARANALTTVLTGGGYNNGGGASPAGANIRGVVTVAGTAGTVQMQAGQNTANASSTTVKAGSWLRFTKVVT